MKKTINCCLTFFLFLFVFAGEMPLMLQTDTSTAYAKDNTSKIKGGIGGGIGGGRGHKVPEPGMLSLLGTSAMGFGIAYFVGRKKRK